MKQDVFQLYADARFTSPYAMSVFVTLREKQLPFELLTVDLGSHANQGAAYAAKSLTQRVPTLVHEDFALSESSAITEYLEDVFPQTRVYPQDARLRARARQVQAFLRSDLMPIREERSTEGVFYGRRYGPLSRDARAAVEKLVYVAQSLLPQGADHLFGQWCIADTDLAVMLNRLIMNGDSVPERLAAYAGRQWSRLSVQQWVGLTRPASSSSPEPGFA